MNQIYKKENFIVVPISNNYLVINIEKVFKKGHTYVKNIGIARLLIDLVLYKKLPKNPYFVDNLIKITMDKSYIEKLKEFKENSFISYEKLMSAASYRRAKGGALRQIK